MSLSAYGFRKVGDWQQYTRIRSGIKFVPRNLTQGRAIYAFVVGKKVKYIGICDARKTTLKERMKRYMYWTGEGLNERVAKIIRQCLKDGKRVRIHALDPDRASTRYCGLGVDLVRGLEYPLIAEFDPEWNGTRWRAAIESSGT